MAGGETILPPVASYRATTADGWELSLRRYRGGGGLPVVLCPGYGCSSAFLDWDERHSLARYLARRGFDVWLLDLRGRGESRPGPGARWSWTFDDFVRYDAPAAVWRVRGETGRERLFWVGHSMGGLVAYAFAGTTALGREALAAIVAVASPLRLPTPAWPALLRVARLLLRPPFPPTVPQRRLLSLAWRAVEGSRLVRILMNPDNCDVSRAGRALRGSLHDVPAAKLLQLAEWAQRGVFRSAGGEVDYRAGLLRVTVPLLAIAGSDDRLAPPAHVRLAVSEVAAEDRTDLELGTATGCAADYGHVDLVLGRNAPEEVFPRIGDWLARRSGRP